MSTKDPQSQGDNNSFLLFEAAKSNTSATEQELSSPSQLGRVSDSSDNDKRTMEYALWGTGLSVWVYERELKKLIVKAFIRGQYRLQREFASFDEFCDEVHGEDVNELRHVWFEVLSGELVSFTQQFRMLIEDEYRWILLRGRVTASDDSGVVELVGTFLDVSEQKNSEAQSKLMSYVFAQTSQPMLIVESNLSIIDVNTAFFNQIDRNYSPIENENLAERMSFSRSDMETLKNHGALQLEKEYKLSDTHFVPVSVSISLFHTNHDDLHYYIVALSNLSQQKRTEQALHKLANYDPLSGLLNRRALNHTMKGLIERSTPFALFFIDLDGFRTINDTFGHEFGDAVLEALGSDLQSELHDAVSICRWGGDELIAIFQDTEPARIAEHAKRISKILQKQNIHYNGQRFNLDAHMGVALYPEHCKTGQDAVKMADAALYFIKKGLVENERLACHADGDDANAAGAKEAAPLRWCIYSQGMSDDKLAELSFINDVRSAIKEKQLNFVLQGKFSEKRQLIGAELLCRWHSDKHGHVSPGRFIPIIEKHGMENDLGALALDSAMSFLAILETVGVKIPISVNISSSQFLHASFSELAKSLLKKHAIDAQLIELEITESVFMVDEDAATQTFEDIRAMGFRISLDDFGTGYSSLGYLSKYHFDVVKIDRQFIIDLTENLKAQKLFVAILNMCQALDIDTVVEGIETEQQFTLLSETGVKKFQGFLLGRPTSLDEFVLAHRPAQMH